jgi:DNA-directed RNA polymerase specialized sigma24 family protein
MAAGALKLENPRNLLARTIVDEILSWPRQPRQIFMQVRYGGIKIDEVASHFGISSAEVRQILSVYEGKLQTAVKFYRHIL